MGLCGATAPEGVWTAPHHAPCRTAQPQSSTPMLPEGPTQAIFLAAMLQKEQLTTKEQSSKWEKTTQRMCDFGLKNNNSWSLHNKANGMKFEVSWEKMKSQNTLARK